MRGIFLFIILLTLGLVLVFGGIGFYFNMTKPLQITSPIDSKHMGESTDYVIDIDDDFGIPIKSMKFRFILEDGSIHKVSRKIFVQYSIGDNYTYTIRVWR